jgi:hypothetical protein
VTDNEIHLRTAPSEFVHFAKLRMKQTKVEGESKFWEKPDAGEEVVLKRPARFVMIMFDQSSDTASEGHFRILSKVQFDPSALLKRH